MFSTGFKRISWLVLSVLYGQVFCELHAQGIADTDYHAAKDSLEVASIKHGGHVLLLLSKLRIAVSVNTVSESSSDALRFRWGTQSVQMSWLLQPNLVKNRLSLLTGPTLGWDHYRFEGDVYLNHQPSGTSLASTSDIIGSDSLISSNFRNAYVGLPVEFNFHPFRRKDKQGVSFSLGGYVHYILSTRTRIRYRIDGERYTQKLFAPYAVEPWQYGATFRVGLGRAFDVYYQYDIQPLFLKENGPKDGQLNIHRIGISLSL